MLERQCSRESSNRSGDEFLEIGIAKVNASHSLNIVYMKVF